MKLAVSNEGDNGIFYTVQGEGKYTGQPTVFIRLSGCNLRCEWKNTDGTTTKCDTPHTSFNADLSNKQEIKSLVDQIAAFPSSNVVITGGEPFFQKGITELTEQLRDKGFFITIETNGTIYRDHKAQFLSISPKLHSSAINEDYALRQDKFRIQLTQLATLIRQQIDSGRDYQLKFVLNWSDDVDEILELQRQLQEQHEIFIGQHIWVMPQGIESAQLDSKMKWIVALCKQHNWNLSDRLHIRIWGHQKGV